LAPADELDGFWFGFNYSEPLTANSLQLPVDHGNRRVAQVPGK